MPYKIFRTGEEHCIYKLDAKGKRTGDSLGCHPNLAKAGAQMRALYAAEDDEGETDSAKASDAAAVYDQLEIERPMSLKYSAGQKRDKGGRWSAGGGAGGGDFSGAGLEDKGHKMGAKIWFRGDEVTITSNPYEK